jgi:quercetin dioxygenase-like cupin family protein
MVGWTTREWIHAADNEKSALLKSQVVTAADVKSEEMTLKGKPTGEAAAYFKGETAGTKNFLVVRFALNPGAEPNPPHVHAEEEVLIVASGTGEIECDDKTTKVGPGSILYAAPNVKHGIRNTGKDAMVFYFVKFTGVASRREGEKQVKTAVVFVCPGPRARLP